MTILVKMWKIRKALAKSPLKLLSEDKSKENNVIIELNKNKSNEDESDNLNDLTNKKGRSKWNK